MGPKIDKLFQYSSHICTIDPKKFTKTQTYIRGLELDTTRVGKRDSSDISIEAKTRESIV